MKSWTFLGLLTLLAACGDPVPAGDGPTRPSDGKERDSGRRMPPADAAPASPTMDAATPEDGAPTADAEPAPAPDSAPPEDATPPVDAAPDADPDAAPEPEPELLRFLVLGDVGKGNAGQLQVAEAAAEACEEMGGCAFALLLGDNIYDAGAADADDPQWESKFETPYAGLDIPFYATLGNHDYGGPSVLQELVDGLGGLGIDRTRGMAQVAYAETQDKFRCPDIFYRFQAGPVELVSLNTATLFWKDLEFVETLAGFEPDNEAQLDALDEWAEAPLAPWRIAFGHHPYLSNGRHGDAGAYDGVFIDGLIGSGSALKDFFEEHVVGTFDVFLAGHDHNQQDLGEVDGTHLVVSGAGASVRELADRNRNPTFYQSEELGFTVIEADERRMRFIFYEVPPDDGAARPWVEVHRRQILR